MIRIDQKDSCCGCNACGDICPRGAITFRSDEEGFWYPHVDTDCCIDCHKCESVCPLLHLDSLHNYGQTQPRVYGGYHKNVAIRFDSTSGGLFSALANSMYRQGGYVSGAVFNSDWSVSNYISNNKKDLPRLRSSKYVQSNAEGLYKEIHRLLQSGERVLACGTPCQMAALRTYLRKDYDNLVIVDFICRAINSPKAYRRYLDYLEQLYGGKIVYIKAKNKEHGWRSLARKVVFDNGKVYYGEGHQDHYRRGYHGNYFERPSCYHCKFKGLPRISDITLGDFWGVESVDCSIDGNLGTSVVLVNTEKGQRFFDTIISKLVVKEFSIEDVLKGNRGPIMGDCCIMPVGIDRKAMFKDMDTMRFDQLAMKYFPPVTPSVSMMRKLRFKARVMLHSILHPVQLWRDIRWRADSHIQGRVAVKSHCALDLHENAKIVVKSGLLILGEKKNRFSKLETRLFIDQDGLFEVSGTRSIKYDSDIQVFKGAVLSMGEGNCNSGLKIVCAERISIGHHTHIGRDVWIRDNNGGHTIIQTGYTNSAPVLIGDYCWIGSNVIIMKGVTIGDGAVIAANSVVTSNIPARCLASGNPAQIVSENINWVH